jgi:hypothetical protein
MVGVMEGVTVGVHVLVGVTVGVGEGVGEGHTFGLIFRLTRSEPSANLYRPDRGGKNLLKPFAPVPSQC